MLQVSVSVQATVTVLFGFWLHLLYKLQA